MTIELIELLAYPATAFLAVALTTKLIERQRDVLYGPYIWGRKTGYDGFREELDAYMVAIGLKRGYGRFAVKFAAVSILASAIIG
ncbi:MAG TPA: hypothetical protein VFL62_06175 [Bradyrhizobium sp.]|uniref:hypothetical protein n=1 Tax=Bradyrhizobium sp. TaxID=376 RepID=UPI002D7E9F00|nr:hypothetical protein [Bradyrhizobium sp.]HET7885793.1 hypothetical protein [Bradyrhizobium sp.]